ncbi:MAG: hypothetical protein KF891_01710 [Rhizobacter sp.]|nr:hypothetical protein [Rhizobacter sp.]
MARRIAEPGAALVARRWRSPWRARDACGQRVGRGQRRGACAGAGAGLPQQREDARLQAEAARVESESLLRLALDASADHDWDMDLRTGEIKHSARHDRSFRSATPSRSSAGRSTTSGARCTTTTTPA